MQAVVFSYESDYDRPEKYAGISQCIDKADNVVHGHAFYMRCKGHKLRNNVGSATTDHSKANG